MAYQGPAKSERDSRIVTSRIILLVATGWEVGFCNLTNHKWPSQSTGFSKLWIIQQNYNVVPSSYELVYKRFMADYVLYTY